MYEEPDVTEYDSDKCFLGAVGTGGNNSWQVTLQLNDNPTEFQINTGAEASIISERIYQKIGSPSLSQVMQTFKGPDQSILPIMGRFTGKLRKDNVEVEQEIFVAKEIHKSLLGQPAIEVLGLVQRIRGVRTKQLDPVEQFPNLFQGLGKLQGKIQHQATEGSKAVCPHHSTQSPHTSHEASQGGTRMNGENGSDIPDQQTNRLVCRNGCGAKS